jgi:S1-C subfamily serine protease
MLEPYNDTLVHISNKDYSNRGTGFIIHRDDQGRTYILTCKHVVRGAAASDDPQRTVWINRVYKAETLVYPDSNDAPDLAVVRSSASELSGQRVVSLGTLALRLETQILNFRALQGQAEEPQLTNYLIASPKQREIQLQNSEVQPIVRGHSGSPVFDIHSYHVVAIVTDVATDNKKDNDPPKG